MMYCIEVQGRKKFLPLANARLSNAQLPNKVWQQSVENTLCSDEIGTPTKSASHCLAMRFQNARILELSIAQPLTVCDA